MDEHHETADRAKVARLTGPFSSFGLLRRPRVHRSFLSASFLDNPASYRAAEWRVRRTQMRDDLFSRQRLHPTSTAHGIHDLVSGNVFGTARLRRARRRPSVSSPLVSALDLPRLCPRTRRPRTRRPRHSLLRGTLKSRVEDENFLSTSCPFLVTTPILDPATLDPFLNV